jgi:YD repeat-containing protein
MGQLCGVEYPDGTFEQYSYNDEGLLKEARNTNSRVKITRDKLGRVKEEWQDGHTVTSRYDKITLYVAFFFLIDRKSNLQLSNKKSRILCIDIP